ncbi:MAG TPA: response regulator transcription factor [Streptosporangiaceae bacterium]|nr:response regulator transcription factor [Streptosporangiaceae bacterium]HEX2822978.1 response regulator transcription factor [Streptosporangiaceae bacterium]
MNAGTKPLRVLIADDHEPTRDDVRRALEGDEMFDICAVVADAAQAVRAAVCEQPDVCLLDVRMPGSGVAAAWEIAARLPDTKIVMLTVSDDDADLFAALRAGADGYLLKTMNLKRLRDALIGVCSGEAAIQRTLVARVLDRFHGREPRWRQVVSSQGTGQRLTSREWEVLELLAQRRSTAEIAGKLVLSASAVRVHIASIVHKLQVADRAAVVELFGRSRS